VKLGFPENSMYLINNGFDINTWSRDDILRENLRNKLKLSESDLVVGYIGNFHKNKNVKLLINVISQLSTDYPSLYAVFIGKGLDRDNLFLQEYIKNYPTKNLFLLGSIVEIENYYSIFDCFCLTSNSEAFPNVIGEAMGHGLYCIASDVGDVALLLDEVGAIFPRDDDNELKKRLIYWINHKEKLKLLGQKARLRIKDK
jgi:glycosyltransferase involved in cell wall biosynthesis